jgi:ComF family protein
VARSALLFDGTTRNLIHQFKYSGKTLLRRPLAILTAERLDTFARECLPDLLLPVPLHKKRLQQRGFNQALLLGELFAKRWRIGLQRNNLRRIRWTEPQVNLSGVERHENVKGAFALADPAAIARQRILLVDDVYTTGSTVQECARVLIQGGAAAVTVITIARAAE